MLACASKRLSSVGRKQSESLRFRACQSGGTLTHVLTVSPACEPAIVRGGKLYTHHPRKATKIQTDMNMFAVA